MANKWIGIGRLTRDPEVRYTQGAEPLCIAKYTLAIDRKIKRDGEPAADFIPCVALGRNAEFAEKYLRKGMKIYVEGRLQTGSYTNREGQKVYTTDIIIESQEFCESKGSSAQEQEAPQSNNGFMNIPEGIDEELPFN